jgi:hypothetical protein
MQAVESNEIALIEHLSPTAGAPNGFPALTGNGSPSRGAAVKRVPVS